MGELADWARSTSRFMKIANGETVEVVFNGATKTISTYDNKTMTICYQFDEKFFNSQSKRLAEIFDEIPVGSKVRITKTGTAQSTKYNVEVIG
jgi:hypothetical protein